MAWFLQHSSVGTQMVREDGVALCGAHIEEAAPGAPRFAFWVLSVDSRERQYCPDDVLGWLVVEPKFKLTLRGKRVAFQACCTASVGESPNGIKAFLEPAPLGSAPSKTRGDDWVQLIQSADGAFQCETWKWHVEPPRAGQPPTPASGIPMGGISAMGPNAVFDAGAFRMGCFDSLPPAMAGALPTHEEEAPIVV